MTDREFTIKNIANPDINNELNLIGFDQSYLKQAADKYRYKNIKIYDLTPAQANIIKQIALSTGTDCAVHRNVVSGQIEKSDIILGGSYSQLNKISSKLIKQPFSLPKLAEEIKKELTHTKNTPKIVGILNITPNSFSDGGKYNDTEKACLRINELVSEGADIIDIGAESTKQGAKPVSIKEQLKKLLPVLEYIKSNNINVPISIDTRSSKVAKECLKMGASIINDVSGLKYDKDMAKIISDYDTTVIIQHSLGNDITQKCHKYNNTIDDIYIDLQKQVKYAENLGIKKIITDVGIGFDKTADVDLTLIKRIDEFHSLGYPIMLGISRKSFMGLKNSSNEEKDTFTLAFNMLAIQNGVEYLRVHNVKLHKKLLSIINNSAI